MTKTITRILFLSLILSFFGCQNNKEVNAYLDQLHQDGNLNGNVLVIKDGKTLFEKSYGYADGSKTILLNKDYRFNIGSIYKEFPAVAIMQLQEQNRINLNDKISKYLPELPSWSEIISIKQVLQYASGLPRINWNSYFSNGINVTEDDLVKDLQAIKTLEFEPGSDYLYSNNNPILLIKIVESITQSSFNDYIQEHIFNPYNMNGTVIKDQFPYTDKTLMAIPFDTDFKEDGYKLSVKSLLFSSTTQDMAEWFEQLGDFEVVSKLSVKTLSEEAKIGDNIQAPLGLSNWENGTMIEHSHHGSSGNYECMVRRFKEDEITIVILTNQKHGNVYDISDKIYDILKKDI